MQGGCCCSLPYEQCCGKRAQTLSAPYNDLLQNRFGLSAPPVVIVDYDLLAEKIVARLKAKDI